MIPARRTMDVVRPIKIATGRGGNRFKCLINANELVNSKRPGVHLTRVFINDIFDDKPTPQYYYFNVDKMF